MEAYRCPHNPIIKPCDIVASQKDFEVIGVFNAAVARFGDEVILLLRVAEKPISRHPEIVQAGVYDCQRQRVVFKDFSTDNRANDFSDSRLIITPEGTYLTSISHLRLARSTDGVDFRVEQEPALSPACDYEAFGIEDPRISLIEGIYYVNYVAVSPLGVTTALASTGDFSSFERHGVIFCPDNKDVVIFPEKIGDRYYALHRPDSGLFQKKDIWIADSSDLVCWGNHRRLISTQDSRWDNLKIGAGAPPFRTTEGWLEIYHGVNQDNRYCLGGLLLDADEPWKVLARSPEPILVPEANYECEGFFGNVVFSCGLLCEEETLKIYYGAADTSICYAELPLREVLQSLKTV